MTGIGSIKDQTSQVLLKSKSSSAVQKVEDEQPAAATKATTTASESVQSRIGKWFAQAGIATPKFGQVEQDIHKKTARRELMKQQRKLKNLERILERAMDFAVEQDIDDNIDPDWFFSFLNMAEEIYSPVMQEIWGKIFSTEVAHPGTFSLRTLQTLKQLTQRDAQIFQIAVGLACRKKGEYSPKLIYGYYQKPSMFALLNLKKSHQLNLAEYGIAYPHILSLMDAGLIYNSEIESGEFSLGQQTEWRCGGEPLFLTPRRKGLILNYYKFTPTGSELSKLVTSKVNALYIEGLKSILQTGFTISE